MKIKDVQGSLIADAVVLSGETVNSASVVNRLTDLTAGGTPQKSITLRDLAGTHDFSNLGSQSSDYNIKATFTATSAGSIDFSAAALATIDNFELSADGSFVASGAELNGKTLTVVICPSLIDETFQEEDEHDDAYLEDRWTLRF